MSPQLKGVSIPATPMLLDGVEYEAYELSDRDYEELDIWIKGYYIESNRKYANAMGLTDEARKEIIDSAVRTASDIGWSTPEGWKIINSFPGVARLAYHMIRKKVPVAQLEKIIRANPTDTVPVIFNTYSDLVKIEVPEEGASEGPKSEG